MLADIRKKITAFSAAASAVLLFLLFAFSVFQFLTKYKAESMNKIIGIFLVWSFMFGAVYCFGENEHISFNMASSKTGKKMRFVLKRIVNIFIFIFSISVLLSGGIMLLAKNFSQHLPFFDNILYFILPVSGILTAFISFSNITERFTDTLSE